MAESFQAEGVDYILGMFPRSASTVPANLWCALIFTSASNSASTVPSTSATASPITGWVEASYTGYTRMVVAGSNWSIPAASNTGRITTNCQLTFPTVGAVPPASAIAGFAICGASVPQNNDKVIFIANFNDQTPVTLATNDVIKVTPSWELDF